MKYFLFFFLLAFLNFNKSFSQANCQVIDYNTEISIEKGKLSKKITYLIQINNRDGDWVTEISIPYQNGNKINIKEALILDPQNNLRRKIKKNEIVAKSDISYGSFFEDRMVKEFTLKWHQYPYRIKYSYEVTYDEYLHIADWTPMVYTTVPVQNAVLTINTPKSLKLNLSYTDSIDFEKNELDENTVYQWTSSYNDRYQRETFAPHTMDCIPKVSVVPLEFNYYNNGSFESWESFGNWQFEIIEPLNQLTDLEKKNIDKLIAGISDKREKVRILYNYLQKNTRYINISIEEGGLVPYPAEYVCNNKYGDCKALTNYMKAMLEYIGIESFYTLIYGNDIPKRIDVSFPSQQFNHVILCVPMEADSIWLENTSQYSPFNYLGTFTQNRKGLLIKENESKLVNTPKLKLSDVEGNAFYHYTLDEKWGGKLRVEKVLRGAEFEKFKYIDLHFSEREKDKYFNQKQSLKNSELLSYNIQQSQNDRYLNLISTYSLHDQLRKFGEITAFQLKSTIDINLEKVSLRNSDLLVSYPIYRRDSIVYTKSFSYPIKVKMPDDKILITKYGEYEESYMSTETEVIVNRTFKLFQGSYSKMEYSSFFDFIENIKNIQKQSVLILTPK